MSEGSFVGETRQRARGAVSARFARAGRQTEAARIYETGGLRLRFPRSGAECEAVIVNTGGGMTGGDEARIDLACDAGAEAIATTQAAEKIYRAEGAPTRVSVRLAVAPGASLTWAPQETLLYDRANLSRVLEADVAADASLLIVESAIFGRLASGETQADATFLDQWRIRRDGRLVFAEALRLDHAASRLDKRALGAGARAIATMVWFDRQAPNRLDELREALDAMSGAEEAAEVGVTALDGFLLARFVAASPKRLREALIVAMQTLRGRAPPRVWT